MPVPRPLPPRPSLEHARKEAKALLRALRASDPAAHARARAQCAPARADVPDETLLADAQLVVAREHGFASWPRLARYLEDLERQTHGHVQLHGEPRHFESHARWLLARHRARDVVAARAFAAYVPRLYGEPLDAVFASDITEDEARLAVAREHGAPSWEVLLARLADNKRTEPGPWERDPFHPAFLAMDAGDLAALERIVAEHPELLRPSENDLSAGRTLMSAALSAERRRGAEVTRPILEWLTARGFDRAQELGARLCGHKGMTVDEVRALLEQGADPDWVAPNGISVLEHALLRYWSGAAVDVLAARATPRRALWIAAGLGDVDGVRAFLDARGKPTAEARHARPEFVAVGERTGPAPLPDADDDEIQLETLWVAVINGRTQVLEYLVSRGAPIDSTMFGMPLLNIAVGNAMADVVECLVRCGASLDLRGTQPTSTARELAREFLESSPESSVRQRIARACGWDVDALLAAHASRPATEPQRAADLEAVVSLALEDAARVGARVASAENLFVGLLRVGGPALYFVVQESGVDNLRLREALHARLEPEAPPPDTRPPLAEDAQGALLAATQLARGRRHEVVHGMHLLHALTADSSGAAASLLARYGANVSAMRDRLISLL